MWNGNEYFVSAFGFLWVFRTNNKQRDFVINESSTAVAPDIPFLFAFPPGREGEQLAGAGEIMVLNISEIPIMHFESI